MIFTIAYALLTFIGLFIGLLFLFFVPLIGLIYSYFQSWWFEDSFGLGLAPFLNRDNWYAGIFMQVVYVS